MASGVSKRQQARNEKALQDLVNTVPGNKICADCNQRNPGWASWSLGIFLCMRCASIHRKLGTHISKVKSLSMDGWSSEQVENMRKVGNVVSNKTYNPGNKRAPMPLDADEADSAMERFIRSKYMQFEGDKSKGYARDGQTGGDGISGKTTSTVRGTGGKWARRESGIRVSSESEGTPPPPPPKMGNRFFNSAKLPKSASFPLSFGRSKKSIGEMHGPNSQANAKNQSKQTKLLGTSLGHDHPDDLAGKVRQLRDMGFTDEKRNLMILKGVSGNVDKAIEALIRLGEGDMATPSFASAQRTFSPAPLTPSSADFSSNPSPGPKCKLVDAPPLSSHSTGTLQNRNPFYNTINNPFEMPSQQNVYEHSSLSAPQQQQLFPHHTGGAPPTQAFQQPIMYQQPMTPPMSQHQNYASASSNSDQTYASTVGMQQQQAPNMAQSHQTAGYNPFLQAPNQQPQLSLTPVSQDQSGMFANNPFAKSPTRFASPSLNQIPEQSQQNFYSQPQPQHDNNPFFYGLSQAPQPEPNMAFHQVPQAYNHPQQAYNHIQQAQNHPTHQSQGYDLKKSIMDLYNYPSLAPSPLQQSQEVSSMGATAAAPRQVASLPGAHRSISTPVAGTNNPFMSGKMASTGAEPAVGGGGGMSRDSVNLGLEMAWNNGRHSPDAFASLSARS